MEIRRNTRTAPTPGRQQFAQAENFSLEPLLKGAAALGAGLNENRRQGQQYELQKRLLEEMNSLGEDLERRRLAPDFDPDTFATQADSDYTDRVNAVTAEFRTKGYDPDLVDDFFLGMARVRNGLTDKASLYQTSALTQRAATSVDALISEGTKTIVNDPSLYDSTASMLEDTVRMNPYLNDEQKTKAIAAIRPSLKGAGAQSLLMDNPQFIIEQLDPDRRWEQVRAAATGGTFSGSTPNAGTKAGPQQEAIRTAAAELGVSPVELAGLASYESAGTMNPNIAGGDGGRYVGIFQFGPEEQRKYGVSRTSSFEDQVKALVRFAKDRGYKPGMGWEKLYTTINAGNPFASVRAADSNGTQLQHYEKIQRDHFGKAREFLGANADLVEGGERVPQAGDVVAIDPGAPTGDISEFDTTRELPAAPVDLHPVLRDLDGAQRLDILEKAYAQTARKTAVDRSALDVAIANVKAEALQNGDVAARIPTREEIFAILDPVEAEQVWSDMNQTIALGKTAKTFNTLSPAQIDSRIEALRPQQGSPTYATDLQLFQAAEKAKAQVLQQREADPAGYVLANFPEVAKAAEKGERFFYPAVDRAYKQLGIDPSRTSPLPKAAQENILRQWPTMTPRARREFFQKNFLNMGERRFADFTRGAEGTEMDTERKIFAVTVNRVSAATMDEIFAGRDAIRKDPARRPSPQALTEYFRKTSFRAVTSMNPDASAAVQAAADALYVQKGGDANNIDPNLYNQALSQALGGSLPYNDAKGAVKDFTILPPRVSPQRFENWVGSLRPGILSGLSAEGTAPLYGDLKTKVMLNDIVDDGVFVMVAPGEYIIRMASDGRPLKTATGRNFIVRLRPEDIK